MSFATNYIAVGAAQDESDEPCVVMVNTVVLAERTARKLADDLLRDANYLWPIEGEEHMKPIAWMYRDALGTHFTEYEQEWVDTEGVEYVAPLFTSRRPCRVTVNDMYITNGTDYDTVWIGEVAGGEGGVFSKDKFYVVLQQFYKESM